MVKKAMPQEVQKRLDNVVRLMKMEWPLFSEHLIHPMENSRKEKQKEKVVNKYLASKLTQLQLSELNSKQKKEKSKVQAPVVTMEPPQMPQITAAVYQRPTEPQLPCHPQVSQGPAPIMPSAPPQPTQHAPLPPIHVHVNQPQPNRGPSFRGQPGQRGGMYRQGRRRGFFSQGPRRGQSHAQLNEDFDGQMLCWGCGQSCRTNKWLS